MPGYPCWTELGEDETPSEGQQSEEGEDDTVVLQGKRSIVGIEDVVHEEDYNRFDDLPPFGQNVDLNVIEDGGAEAYIRLDHNEGRIV